MAEYIDRDELLNKIEAAQNSLMSDDDALWGMNQKYYKGLAWAHRLIDDSPVVDAVPVVHARWKDSDFIKGLLACASCGAQRNPNFKIGGGAWHFCPNCGAKMDQEV